MKLIFFLIVAIAAVCVTSQVCPDPDGEDVTQFPHADCTKFWKCDRGVAFELECPEYEPNKWLHYNAELRVCDWPESAGCA